MLAAVWLPLTGWRLAFILLERQGTTLTELSRVIRYRVPPLGFKRHFAVSLFSMWCIFILATPSQFFAPMLTGAISWRPETKMTDAEGVLVTAPGNTDAYAYHQWAENSRKYEVFGAFGLSAAAASENFKNADNQIYRRKIPSLLGYPVNSTIENVTVPYFKVEGPLHWITSEQDAGNDMPVLQRVVGDPRYPALNITKPWNPFFQGTDIGRVTIVNTRVWSSAPKDESATYTSSAGVYVYPTATIERGTKLLAISVHFGSGCKNGSEARLGAVPDALLYEADSGSDMDSSAGRTSSCFMFARFNYSAGGITCRNCRITSDSVVEAARDTSWTAEPDALTEQAIAMMPETLFYMKIANTSSAPLWNNMENYTIGMLTTAYQASWNSLANYWAGGTFTATSSLRRPVPVLVADISLWRVWTWFGINALLTVSGIFLAVLQARSRAKTVRNPEISALLLDPSRVFQGDGSGLCNAVDVGKGDGELRLRLVVPGVTGTTYQHAFLEVEGEQYEQVTQVEGQELKHVSYREHS